MSVQEMIIDLELLRTISDKSRLDEFLEDGPKPEPLTKLPRSTQYMSEKEAKQLDSLQLDSDDELSFDKWADKITKNK